MLGVLAMVALSGCGTGESAPMPLARAQFIKRADEICERADQRFQELFDDYLHENGIGLPPERTLAQWSGIVENVLAPTIEGEVERIRALGAPRGDSKRIEAILDAVEEGLGKVRENPTVEADTEAQFAKSKRLADAYGLTVCGR